MTDRPTPREIKTYMLMTLSQYPQEFIDPLTDEINLTLLIEDAINTLEPEHDPQDHNQLEPYEEAAHTVFIDHHAANPPGKDKGQ